MHQQPDHRYARPDTRWVYDHRPVCPDPYYNRPAPRNYYYTPYYTRWWVHPYYRYQYATTVVVAFDFYVDPWNTYWAPPARAGWMWTPGWYEYGWWHPGYWAPMGPAPRANYVYVQGFWYNDGYVEGYYRPETRVEPEEEWRWVDGYYLDDGTYIWGYWEPTEPGPEGYVWEAGFYDGETYVDGFWRPEYRVGYSWASAYYDGQGVYHAGYWLPTEERPGQIWIPGWFDGNEWVAGYWVNESDFDSAQPDNWQAPEGWDSGWQVGSGWGDGEVLENQSDFQETPGAAYEPAIQGSGYDDVESIPLAIPVGE